MPLGCDGLKLVARWGQLETGIGSYAGSGLKFILLVALAEVAVGKSWLSSINA